MKVKLQAMAAPSRSLPRSASGRADVSSPFSSNTSHHPVSTPTTPAAVSAAAASFGGTPTDTPPATPNDKSKAAGASSSYAAMWSPRKFMQRAARAFRGGRSRRKRMVNAAGDEPTMPNSCKVSVTDLTRVLSPGAETACCNDAHCVAAPAATAREEEEEEHRPDEAVPEKIIREANHHQAPPAVAAAAAEEECAAKPAEEKVAGAADEKEEEEEDPKKAASPVPEPETPVAAAVAEDVADKFMTVVKEAMKKHEEETAAAENKDNDEKAEALRRWGSRVRTAMEARPESELPRRREAARSKNDVIEEARTKLLEKRQSRVKALVGAFETVMDAKQEVAAGKPLHHHRMSA
ncbi:hypothetical protein ACP70R_028928 [Stipagrostis hirtigluma subsp. patula]